MMVLGTILMAGASLTASLFVVQVAVLPIVFRYSKCVQRKIVFSNCINYPKDLDYDHPSKYDVVGGRNINIEFDSNVDDCPIKIGIWHLTSQSNFSRIFIGKDNNVMEDSTAFDLQNTTQPILLYFHGNSNHRASQHRLEAYKVFQSLNFHVITFDYRGYGDSTDVRPTEQGVVEDALRVYAWLHSNIGRGGDRPLVLLWGHSLGTAVAANLVANLQSLCSHHLHQDCLPLPDALILEAPFNNLIEEISSHPMSKLVSWLPYYACMFLRPFVLSSDYEFCTDQHLANVTALPILILHSRGDKIVPYELAVKGCGLGHNNLCSASEIHTVVGSFVDSVKTMKQSLKEKADEKTKQLEEEKLIETKVDDQMETPLELISKVL